MTQIKFQGWMKKIRNGSWQPVCQAPTGRECQNIIDHMFEKLNFQAYSALVLPVPETPYGNLKMRLRGPDER